MTARDPFDPYRVLDVPRAATARDIARAYRVLAKRFHPDLHGTDVSDEMRQLNRAWRILSDPARRREWELAHPVPAPAGPHWAPTRPGHPAPSSAEPPLHRWAAWDAAPPAAGGHVADVTAVPRARARAAEPPAVRGFRDSVWPAIGVAAVLVAAVGTLAWLASTRTVASSPREALTLAGVTPLTFETLDTEHAVAVHAVAGGRLGLAAMELGDDGWTARGLAEAVTRGAFSVQLVGDPEPPLGPWHSLVFGRAHPGVERVELEGLDFVGGEVTNGTWAIAIRDRVAAAALEWRFVLPDGRVMLEGSGLLDG